MANARSQRWPAIRDLRAFALLLPLAVAVPVWGQMVPRPCGAVRFEITADAFESRPWRTAAASALRTTLEQEIENAFPFIDWKEAKRESDIVFVGSIHDLSKRGIVLDYHAEIGKKAYGTGFPSTLLFSVHGQKPTERKDLERIADGVITTDFRTDSAIETVIENIFGYVILAHEVRPLTPRLLVPLPFRDLRMARNSKLRIDLSSRLTDADAYENGSIELTPVRQRVGIPDEGAVEASIASIDFPPLTPTSREVGTIVQQPPAERVEVFLAKFVRASAYEADASGNSLTPR